MVAKYHTTWMYVLQIQRDVKGRGIVWHDTALYDRDAKELQDQECPRQRDPQGW